MHVGSTFSSAAGTITMLPAIHGAPLPHSCPPRLPAPPCSVCLIAGDISPIDVITPLPVLCEDNDVPYIYVPSKARAPAAPRAAGLGSLSRFRSLPNPARLFRCVGADPRPLGPAACRRSWARRG